MSPPHALGTQPVDTGTIHRRVCSAPIAGEFGPFVCGLLASPGSGDRGLGTVLGVGGSGGWLWRVCSGACFPMVAT